MKLIKIHKKKDVYAQVDDEDYNYLVQWKWSVSKGVNTSYVNKKERLPNGKRITVSMHRLLLGITNSKTVGDHKDGNGLNNQRSNIRIATRIQNKINCNHKLKGKSKYLGVSIHRHKSKNGKIYEYWIAQIWKNGINFRLGNFKTELDAAMAYNIKVKEFYGEFAPKLII